MNVSISIRELKKLIIMYIKNEQNKYLDKSLLKEVIKEALIETKQVEKPEYMTTKEVAYELSVQPRTIRDYIKCGKIKAHRVGGGGMYHINRKDFEQNLEEFKSLKYKRVG
ncbi:MAG: helix-turn-helix domain-containing protein [Flavobacteriaceae bacterium]|nr:helix-turn-helix domain-containing protein [Flavobacteriaceae bacterium]